jgi:hypothetical protein
MPYSLDTQLSATVDVKQDDQVDRSSRLLYQLAIHIPAMPSTHVVSSTSPASMSVMLTATAVWPSAGMGGFFLRVRSFAGCAGPSIC